MASMIRHDQFAAPDAPPAPRRTIGLDETLAAFRVEDGERERSLSQLIETEIIPRLLVSHTARPAAEREGLLPASNGGTITADEVAAFAPLSLDVEADELLAHVEAILARGVTVDAVMVDLLAPAARLLGTWWEDDLCDFVDVTMGLWRLQEVVQELAARVPADRLAASGGHSALFVSMPGDQHSFGTVVIEELFRCDGWLTDRLCEVETPDLLKRVADEWFDLVGLTISCDCHIGALTSIIAALRNVSRNPHVCVMVGGRIFSATPALAVEVGADGTAADARLALAVAGNLVRAKEREAAIG